MLKHKFVAAWSEFLLYCLIQAFSNLKMTQLKKKKNPPGQRGISFVHCWAMSLLCLAGLFWTNGKRKSEHVLELYTEGFSISEFLLSLTESIWLSSRARPFSLLPEQNIDVENALS